MTTRHRTSAIRFRSVDPAPSERIPGGTVRQIAKVPWLTSPIGEVVSKPSEKPPDQGSRGRVRTLWYFIPADPGGKILHCDTVVEALHRTVRQFYHGVYDLKNAKRGRIIASGDIDDVESKVLVWSGTGDAWMDADLGATHSFLQDVLRFCPSASIRTGDWDGNSPGRSGVEATVRSSDADGLKREIKELVEGLLSARETPEGP